MQPILIMDIGGTNARLALSEGNHIHESKNYAVSDFPGPGPIIAEYCSEIHVPIPKCSVAAVAAPVANPNAVAFGNNLRWRRVNFLRVGQRLRTHFHLLNDFVAQAYALLRVRESNLIPFTERLPHIFSSQKSEKQSDTALPADKRVLILGPGTGLGIAMAYISQGKFSVMSSEGGNAAFPARTKEEQEICNEIGRWHKSVSFEMVASGTGLVRVFDAVRSIKGLNTNSKNAEAIVRDALPRDVWREPCEASSVAVKMFTAGLARVASTGTLVFNAYDGVIIGGTMVGKMKGAFDRALFMREFQINALDNNILKDIPVAMLNIDNPGLVGVHAYVRQGLHHVDPA